ncbi:MAG: hypothetical protein E6G79_11720 [Alphaproteobacteria bacterium]|nr:MAG: hypothetical protein E6G79_11720 [Alphaproteobacteria bacterium]
MPLLLVGLAVLAAALSASAQPPAGADPNSELGKWFKSLKSNNGLPCCDVSDCRRVQARLTDGYYEALIDEHWARVPDDKIRHIENPTGQYVACYAYYDGTRDPPPHFFCFVPISLAQLESHLKLAKWRRKTNSLPVV